MFAFGVSWELTSRESSNKAKLSPFIDRFLELWTFLETLWDDRVTLSSFMQKKIPDHRPSVISFFVRYSSHQQKIVINGKLEMSQGFCLFVCFFDK